MVLGRILGLLLQRSVPNLLVLCDMHNFEQKKFEVELYNSLVLVHAAVQEACLFFFRMFSLLFILLHFLCPCFLNNASLAVTMKLNLVVQDAFTILFHEVIFQFFRIIYC